MKKRIVFWSILGAALTMLAVSLGGSVEQPHKLVKVGGEKNHCDCTYRIE